MEYIISYNKIIRYANKYNINRYTSNGKLLTYNKMKNKVRDNKNKKHELSQKQKLYNNIKKYLEDDISDEKLDKALYYYVGKKNNIT